MNINQLITEYELFSPARHPVILSHQKELINFFGSKNIKNLNISNYIQFLKSKDNAPATINTKLAYLSTLLKFAYANGYINKLPQFKFLKLEHNKIKTLNRNEIAKIYKYCRKNKLKELLTACRLALNTGARIENILNLKPDDVENSYIRFYKNKTNNPYSIPINNKIKRLVKSFKPFTKNYQAIYYQFNIMKKRLNLDKQITIHTIRHTFATELINKGVALPVLQKLLNHKNISTTMIYSHIKNKTLEHAINLL